MPRLIDLTGQTYGHWLVLKRGPDNFTKKSKITRWYCQCECGITILVMAGHLRTGASTNCGCKRAGKAVTHGAAIRKPQKKLSPEYRTWRSMRWRCLSPKSPDYKYYGGRGIKICDRWMDYKNFLSDMGERPSPKHSIDRYPNGDGDYEPGNCRWATREQQVESLPQNQRGYRHKSRHGQPRNQGDAI